MAVTTDFLLVNGHTDREVSGRTSRRRIYRSRQRQPAVPQDARSVGIIGTGFLGVFVMVYVVYQAEMPTAATKRSGPRDTMSLVSLKSLGLDDSDKDQTLDSGNLPSCQAAEAGTQCYNDMLYAKRHVSAHPEWYVGLQKGSSLKAFQAFLHKQHTNKGRPRCPKPCGHVETIDEHMLIGKCHTADKGESCYNHVLYTMKENLPKHPEWYPGLHADAGFKTVQAYLHKQRVCPKPCGFVEKRQNKHSCSHLKGKAKEKCVEENDSADRMYHCHTAFAGEPCYGDVLWALDHVGPHPDWYPGLTNESSFAEVQAFLHKQHNGDVLKLCPQPCNETAVDIVDRIDVKRHCHTANPGEKCYKSVVWVVEEGLVKHPEWYENITTESTFEEVQARLNEDDDSACKRIPCPCHTAEEDDKCWQSIQWVYTTGLVNHSNWYADLNSNSTLEEVQARLHRDEHPTCPMPCQRIPWQVKSGDDADHLKSTAVYDQTSI